MNRIVFELKKNLLELYRRGEISQREFDKVATVILRLELRTS